ncbi:AidA/PixA family protein [Burkholderia ubonensis]|uniref:AidA/PixA family protein n=1 Tax=Burkholderia ubonensis TaxID=101571 RepID=UPI000A5D9F49|nr:AidA/PixA family protein [Burkholderia ubonensis]
MHTRKYSSADRASALTRCASCNFDAPYPPQGWPKSTNELKDENRADFFWQTTAVGEGKATYQLIVAIYDRKKNLKGYVTWDPYITISN